MDANQLLTYLNAVLDFNQLSSLPPEQLNQLELTIRHAQPAEQQLVPIEVQNPVNIPKSSDCSCKSK